jgi:transposase
MKTFSAIGIDTSKAHFAVSGADAAGREVWRESGTPARIKKKLSALPPTLIGIEACRGAHLLARELVAMGHDARIVPPQLAKPFVGRNKNDAADARAICRAVREPDTTFVPIKSQAQQAAAMLVDHRRALQARRTEIGNRVRGYAAELGIVAPQGARHVPKILGEILARTDLPTHARLVFEDLAGEWERLGPRVAAAEAALVKAARANEACRRLMEVPSVGPVVAWRTIVAMGDPRRFRAGRAFAGWLGLTPRDHTTANRPASRRHYARRRHGAQGRSRLRGDGAAPTSEAARRTGLRRRAARRLGGAAPAHQEVQGGRGRARQPRGADPVEAPRIRRTLRPRPRPGCRAAGGRGVSPAAPRFAPAGRIRGRPGAPETPAARRARRG